MRSHRTWTLLGMCCLASVAAVSGRNVGAAPAGDVAALRAWQDEARVPGGGWIMAWGYDDSMVKGGKLTKRELDAAFPNHKLLVLHVSLPGAVLNSRALEWAGITRDTPTPEGGIIARGEDGKDPEGLLMETAFLQKAAAQGRLFIDVVVLPAFSEMDQWLGKPEFPFGDWHDRLKLLGLKITQDGSVQGKTASCLEPLLTAGPQGQKDWRGNATLPDEEFAKPFASGRKAGLQVFVHANGDVHRQNLGEERAAFTGPMKSPMDAGLTASNHSDFNVTPLDPFFILWSSMARTTRSGYVLGPDQRVDAWRGLQALTINPAWTYREETRRGSIAPGKLAAFVIVSADPLATPVEAIRDIEVLETIKEGRTIYARH